MYVTYLHLFTSVQVKLSSLSFAYMNRQLTKQSLFTLYVQTSSSETALGDGQMPPRPPMIIRSLCVSTFTVLVQIKSFMQGTTTKKVKKGKNKRDLAKRSEKFQH